MNSQPAPKVLLLEDDDLLRDRILVPRLQQFGFQVDAIARACELDAKLQQQVPDMVVLDISLTDADGFAVTRDLRANVAGIGIVILTALAETQHRVRGLSEGADAYLSKPVDIELLAATLYSLARRLQYASPAQIDHGWRLGAEGWCLLSPSGQPVALSQAEGRLLAPLIETPNRIVTRRTLMQALSMNGQSYAPQQLDTVIHRIRKKVLRELGRSLPLNVVPGEGYVMVFH
jgi:DNA-binding response OmpR family regulator